MKHAWVIIGSLFDLLNCDLWLEKGLWTISLSSEQKRERGLITKKCFKILFKDIFLKRYARYFTCYTQISHYTIFCRGAKQALSLCIVRDKHCLLFWYKWPVWLTDHIVWQPITTKLILTRQTSEKAFIQMTPLPFSTLNQNETHLVIIE